MALTVTTITFTDATNYSSGGLTWDNPTNALTDNDSAATVYQPGVNNPSHHLFVKNPSSYSRTIISPDSVLEGFVMTDEVKATYNYPLGGDYCYDTSVQMFIGGAPTGTNKASGTLWPSDLTGYEVRNYGSSTDMWGTTPTLDQIKNDDWGFGVAIYVSFINTGYIDYLNCTLYAHPGRMMLCV